MTTRQANIILARLGINTPLESVEDQRRRAAWQRRKPHTVAERLVYAVHAAYPDVDLSVLTYKQRSALRNAGCML